DVSGRKSLQQPLHRLFLRGTLQGVVDESEGSWSIPFGASPLETLTILVNHLTRYSVEFKVDEACQRVFAAAAQSREVFENIRKAGVAAKSQSTASAKRLVRRKLSPRFKRDLTDLQYAAVNHLLVVKNGANFSVPGSGKTAVVLAYLDCLMAMKA